MLRGFGAAALHFDPGSRRHDSTVDVGIGAAGLRGCVSLELARARARVLAHVDEARHFHAARLTLLEAARGAARKLSVANERSRAAEQAAERPEYKPPYTRA